MAALTITTDTTGTAGTDPADTPRSPEPAARSARPPGTDVEEPLGIAEVAERMGLTAHTLRYYERIGLLDVPRDAGGRRRYTSADMARVHFITCLRKASLPINRIQHYFALVQDGPHTEPERLALLENHRREVLGRLADLQTALETIELKITLYGGSLGDVLTTDTASTASTAKVVGAASADTTAATTATVASAAGDPPVGTDRVPAPTG